MSAPTELDLRAIFGVKAAVTIPASATDGEYVEMECTAEPSSGTMVHYHPDQEESFQVLEGSLQVLRDGRWIQVDAGSSHTIPRGAVHAWRNASAGVTRFVNVHRPAGGFQAQMETLDRLAKEGKIRGTKDPRSLIYMSMAAAKNRPDVTVKPPQWAVNFMAFVGRRLGYSID